MAGNFFELALDQMDAADWELLEKLASRFLAVDFPNLRTMANPAGDKGRDSELFCPDGDPTVCLQYSVTVDWATKIKGTHERLKQTFPDVNLLVYATNQSIGAKADDLKKYLRSEGRFLDVRDKTWFLERQFTHAAREAAAAELIDRIAMPYIRAYDDRKSKSSPLPTAEARTALTYLTLQLHDDQHGKGLTKVCFDALVRSALRNTSATNRLRRDEVHAHVLAALPSADKAVILPLIDASLKRLKKQYLSYQSQTDSFCLREDECSRIQSRIADTALIDSRFKKYLGVLCIEFLSANGNANANDVKDLQTRIPRIIEALCLSSGEQFVAAVNSGHTDGIQADQLNTAVFNDLNIHRYKSPTVSKYPELIQHVIRAVASSDDEATRAFLKGIATSYTLLAFLNQTPDVQKATKRIFSHGTIWIDTTAILPLFAEELLEPDHSRVYQTIYEACLREGDELFIIRGVLNEVHHHMLRCMSCVRNIGSWEGPVPYLLAQYIKSGRDPAAFRDWLDTFRGEADPITDLEIYLKQEYQITVKSLSEHAHSVEEEVRFAVDRIWSEAHEQRRVSSGHAISDLKDHDVEMYLGVMALRENNPTPELGPRAWLLTRDTTAWSLRNLLKDEFPDLDLRSPLLSVSFLINAIEFSPSRASLTHSIEVRLPTILDVEIEDVIPEGLLQLAEEGRRANAGLPESVIRRKVREQLAQSRRRLWRNADRSDSLSDRLPD